MKFPIYLDYNATTPMDPSVLKAMEPYFCEKFGNAASLTHSYGWEANEVVEIAREKIVGSIGAKDKKEIIFTSGATESNNMVVKGIVQASGKKPAHVITQKTEHKCVLDSCDEIQKEGHEVTFLDVDKYGRVDPEDVKKAIQDNTLLCSIMYANNEIGTIQPIREISTICHEKEVLFHSDAVQAVGKIPVDVEKDGIDLLSISGHKIYGPKGIGALYVNKKRPAIRLKPIIHGGGHEEGIRSGTLNVPAIVGLAKALEICIQKMPEESKRLSELRDHFIHRVLKEIDQTFLNGHQTERLPNNANIAFEYVKDSDLIMAVSKLAIASGSACTSGSPEPSYVIQAIGVKKDFIDSCIRFGFGRWTTREEIDFAVDTLVQAVSKLRAQSPAYEMAMSHS